MSPVQVFGRNAAHDVEIHGETIPEGDVVLLAYGAANRDPRAFDAARASASSTGTRTATSRSATAVTCAWARTSPGSSSRS